MPQPPIVRFAAGNSTEPYSGVWRLAVNKNDIYLGASKSSMSVFKISLHESGVWVVAATQESGATFDKGNRRAKQWRRPKQHSPGVTRGPSILVPHTSLGARPLEPTEGDADVVWFPAPGPEETAEFSLYLVDPGAATRWNSNETVIAKTPLANAGHVTVLASTGPSTKPFQDTVEKLLRENVFGISDIEGFQGGSFLWMTESQDELKVPIVVDLPVPIAESKEGKSTK